MTDHFNRAVTLATNLKIALSALLGRASRGISRLLETERKRAERFMAMAKAPRPFKPFKLENLHSYFHRNIMSRRRSQGHNPGADPRYSLAARRSKDVRAGARQR